MTGDVVSSEGAVGGAAGGHTELVTPDSQTHITSTNQFWMSPQPVKLV